MAKNNNPNGWEVIYTRVPGSLKRKLEAKTGNGTDFKNLQEFAAHLFREAVK